MLTLPYVQQSEFVAHPTYLDLLNIRSQDLNSDDQSQELGNVLLMASAWADQLTYRDLPGGKLAAHVVTEKARLRPDRNGCLHFHPAHVPVLDESLVTSIQVGPTMTQLTTYASPTVWIEDGRSITFDSSGSGTTWSGALQFGFPNNGTPLYSKWTYVGGFPSTALTAATFTAGTSTITVQDATGITAGSTLRIWEPGVEEVITVSDAYTGGTVLPLAAPLVNDHDGTLDTIGVSAMGADIHLAVIMLATVLLIRPDTAAEDAFSGAKIGPETTGKGPVGAGLVTEAEMLLEPYKKTR